jgi:hypothetical protein
VCALVLLLWRHPLWATTAVLALVTLGTMANKQDRARLAALLAKRGSDAGLCSFARCFDLRVVDSWVVRAVYEELEYHCRGEGIEIAMGADDDMQKDLGIDPEDLDMDIATSIASRTGRTFDAYKANPYYGNTNTPRGLVLFFNAQPRGA